jgi:DnaK suppressor protein
MFSMKGEEGCCIPNGSLPNLEIRGRDGARKAFESSGTMALTEAQRHHIEERLLAERESALRVLRRFDGEREASQTAASGDLSDYPFHPADHGTDSYEQEMNTVFAERAGRELEAIDDALRRLYEEPERFGICENTGEPIPFERLDVIPWARTCLEVDAF